MASNSVADSGVTQSDVIIIGGGHNGLIAALYLARAGKKVTVLEKHGECGGATASVRAFAGVDAKLSRYSYLVALLPDQIVRDLELDFHTISRDVSSFTPYLSEGASGSDIKHDGILINRNFDDQSAASILRKSGNSTDVENWRDFYSRIATFAEIVAPTMLEPLITASQMRARIAAQLGQAEADRLWRELIETPLDVTLRNYFSDDVIQGIVLTDGLIGTFASAADRAANICFLYHLIGNGTGEWKVPRGGMGALVSELLRKCHERGISIHTNAEVTELREIPEGVVVKARDGSLFQGRYALAACSPHMLERISGIKAPPSLDGSQLKINMVLRELPELKSGVDPKVAFAGTFHIDESFSTLESAYRSAKAGKIPDPIPSEMYCHTLTDGTILSEELRNRGVHTLTLFGIHIAASLFDKNHDEMKAEITRRTLDGLNRYLVRPIQEYLERDANGELCIEVKTPIELERDIDLPRGNIFHGDLDFPWLEDQGEKGESARLWGGETTSERIFLAGAGALRGGGVSGIAGHNAAMALLDRF